MQKKTNPDKTAKVPVVSVIIPVYGVEKYIERCVRSLFGQTLNSIEYIFIDDCSPDDSIPVMQKVLEEYPQRKEQVRIIRHEANQGVGAARNHGVAACTGDYVIHCDPDDWVDLTLYETMYEKAVETDADVVCAPTVVEYLNNTPFTQKIVPVVTDNVNCYIEKNIGKHLNQLWSKLYKKEIALDTSLEVPDHICMGEDLLRNIQMLNKCQKIALINGSYYHYWQNPDSISRNFIKNHFLNLRDIIDILEKKFPGKYKNVHLYIKKTLFLSAMRNLHKEKGLLPLFDQVWDNTSFKEIVKIIFSKKCTVKCRLLLAALCVSKTQTIRFLKLFYRSSCR